MPNQIKNFILFCFSIAVSILILEILLNTLNLKLNFVQKMTKDDLNFDKVYSDFRKYDSTLGWSLKPNYKIKENPLSWLDWVINGVEHTNFFENRATEYSKGSITGNLWG